MKTLAIEIDEAILEKVEQKAQALDTSVADVVVNYLQKWTADVSDEQRREQARQEMRARFANPDWTFAVGTADTREQRNARR